jgi:hypothetical protein
LLELIPDAIPSRIDWHFMRIEHSGIAENPLNEGV